MKKVTILLLIISALFFVSCKDDVAPVIVLEGDLILDHVLNETFEEPGYKAFDDEDGEITDAVQVSELDINTSGKQFITYSVSDAAGNSSEELRAVNIYNEANNFEGQWNGEYVFPYPGLDIKSYTDSISVSKEKNMFIIINNFGGNAGANIEGQIITGGGDNGTIIKFNNQTIGGTELIVSRAVITDNLSRITFEYTFGEENGVLVLAKN